MSHSPLPWKLSDEDPDLYKDQLLDAEGWLIAAFSDTRDDRHFRDRDATDAANCALTIRAVNAYQPMLEALKLAKNALVEWQHWDSPSWDEDDETALLAATAAIALAEGS